MSKNTGITRRDYFAAMAMQGLIANHEWKSGTILAELAYKYADSLIEESKKTEEVKKDE